MGDILALEEHRRVSRRRGEIGAGVEILFFTGVRYERYEVAPAVEASVQRRSETARKSKRPKAPPKRRA